MKQSFIDIKQASIKEKCVKRKGFLVARLAHLVFWPIVRVFFALGERALTFWPMYEEIARIEQDFEPMVQKHTNTKKVPQKRNKVARIECNTKIQSI